MKTRKVLIPICFIILINIFVLLIIIITTNIGIYKDHLSMSITIGSNRMWAEARRNLRTMKVFSWGPEGTTSRSVRRLDRNTFTSI